MSKSQHSVAEKSVVYEILERAANKAAWPRVSLPEAVELNPKAERGSIADDLEISFVPMASVEAETGRLDASTIRKYAEVKKGYTYFREGDVLFAKITPCMENGKMVVARGLKNGVGFGSTEFHVLRPREGVDASYIYYFVSSANFRRDAAHLMTGAVGQKRVPLSFLEQSTIPLPSLDEQQKLVAEIEKQFSRLDEAVANLKRVKANLKRYKAAVLKAAVEGRLVETEAELARREGRSYETGAQLLQCILETRRRQWKGKGKYKEPAAPDTTGLPELPEGWVRATLEQLCPIFVDSAHRTPKYEVSGFPAIGPRDVVGGTLHLDRARVVNDEEFAIQTERRIPQPGDIVYSRELSLGWGAIVPDGAKLCLSQGMCLFRPDERVSLSYFMHSLNGPEVREQATKHATGSAHPHLNLGEIKGMLFTLPSCGEQQRIGAELDRRLSLLRETETQVDVDLRRAERLRQSVLSSAFSGELVKGVAEPVLA